MVEPVSPPPGFLCVYSRVWFNTPELAPVQIMRRLQRFGIKPDGIIIFLSNEPPFKPTQRLRYRGACSAEAHRGVFAFSVWPLSSEPGLIFPESILIRSERSQLCPERSQLCSENSPVCSERSPVCSERSRLCPERSRLCPESSQLCPESSQLCPESSPVCSERSQLCSENSRLCSESSPVCSESSPVCPESTLLYGPCR